MILKIYIQMFLIIILINFFYVTFSKHSFICAMIDDVNADDNNNYNDGNRFKKNCNYKSNLFVCVCVCVCVFWGGKLGN